MKNLRRAGALIALTGVAVLGYSTVSALAGQPEMVTLCHAAGQAGTTKFVTLTIPYNAAFGQAGHFNENGTPNAGHEQDYLGPCQGDTTSTETTTTTTQTTTTTTTTEPPGPPCTPRNPDGSQGGKDGKPGNDSCAADPTTPAVTTPTPVPEPPQPPVTQPPPTQTTPAETTTPEPEGTTSGGKPPSKPKPPQTKPPKPKPPKPPARVCQPGAVETKPCGVQGSG